MLQSSVVIVIIYTGISTQTVYPPKSEFYCVTVLFNVNITFQLSNVSIILIAQKYFVQLYKKLKETF